MKQSILISLLLVLLASTTFGWDLSLAPGLSVKNAFIYLIFVIYAIETAVRRNRRFELVSVIIPFGIFTAYCMVSWFVTSFIVQPDAYPMIETGIGLKSKRVDHFIVFLLFFYGVASAKDALSLIRIFLWMMVLGNLITVIDGFNIPDLGLIQQRADGRLGGPMGESNQYGAFLACTVPAITALMWDSPRTNRILAILAIMASVLAFVATGSRGAFVGIVFGSVLAAFFLRSVISLRQLVIGMFAAVLGISLLILLFMRTELFEDLIQRFMDKLSGDIYTVSSGRTEIWRNAVSHLMENPINILSGFGWEVYDHLPGLYKAMHNLYLDILFNLGIFALAVYLLTIYNILAKCRQAMRKAMGVSRAHLGACVFGLAALFCSLNFVDLYLAWLFIWAYVGLIMRLAVELQRGYQEETYIEKASVSTPSVVKL